MSIFPSSGMLIKIESASRFLIKNSDSLDFFTFNTRCDYEIPSETNELILRKYKALDPTKFLDTEII